MAQAGTNVACLTSGSDINAVPLPGCNLGTPDVDGSGTLRLTASNVSEVGMAFHSLSLPTKQGLDIRFNSYQYNGSGGNGIAFILAATDPADPSAPSATGPAGGSLGYAANVSGGRPGIPYGYLGFGIDTYGDYTNSDYVGFGCGAPPNLSPSTVYPQTVTVRGPGNDYDGYCIDHSSAENGGSLSGSLDDPVATSRTSVNVPVEIAINPDPSPVVTSTGLNVPAQSYAIEVTPIGGSANVVTGALPAAGNNGIMASQFPSGWIDPSTDLPYQLTLGWAASTGGAYEVHEVNALESTTLNGQLPVFALTGDNSGPDGELPEGGTVDYTLTPGLSSTEGSESEDITVQATFPTDLTPGIASGAGWSCNTITQFVTCTRSPGSAISAGTTLPQITVPTTIGSGAVGSKTVTIKVSSIDSLPASASLTASVVHLSSAPTAVTASVVAGVATASWHPPTSDGGTPITSYTVTATPAGTGTPIVKVVNAPTTSTTLCCLTSDTVYTFSVGATNAVGTSPLGASSSIPTPSQGYRLTGADGGVFDFGNAGFLGSAAAIDLAKPVVGMTETPDSGGYWLAAADGGVFAYGNAAFHGSAVGVSNAPITAIASAPDGGGYWLVADDGGVFAYGDAAFFGSAVGIATSSTVGIAAAGSDGYWLMQSDGSVLAFGTAALHGSSIDDPHTTVTAIASTPDGGGYWLVADDGEVLPFGDAALFGNAKGLSNAPVIGITPTPDGNGYWLTAADGGVFAYGTANFLGSMAGRPLNAPMTAIA